MAEAGKLVNIRITDGDPYTAEITVGDQQLTGIEHLSIVAMPEAPVTAVMQVRVGSVDVEAFGNMVVDVHAAFLRDLADQAARNTVHAFDGWAELERKIRVELGEWDGEE